MAGQSAQQIGNPNGDDGDDNSTSTQGNDERLEHDRSKGKSTVSKCDEGRAVPDLQRRNELRFED